MMRKASCESRRLFNLLVVILTMNCIWVSITTVVHGAVSFEGLFSVYRLLVSVLIAYAIHRYFTLRAITDGLFWVAVTNSALVVVQLLEGLTDQAYLPPWLQYGSLYGNERVEVWRTGGLVPSLQTSSLLAVYALFFGVWRGSRRVMIFAFPLLAVTILIGARTFVPVGLIALIFALIRMPAVTFPWLGVLVLILPSLDGFSSFFQLRFGGLLDVFLRVDFSADYSAADTLNSYRDFSMVELFVGNGEPRYSDAGGNDPFYTRWFFHSGLISVLLLLAVFVVMARYCGRYSSIAYLLLAIACYHNIKGELFTSTGVFNVLVLIVFVFLRERSGRDSTRMPHATDALRPLPHR